MARPWVFVCLLLLIVFTSQFEWEQQFGDAIEASPGISRKQQHNLRRQEVVKEKIILSQEKHIQKLNELVQSLKEQLLKCKSKNNAANGTAIPSTEPLTEIELQPNLES